LVPCYDFGKKCLSMAARTVRSKHNPSGWASQQNYEYEKLLRIMKAKIPLPPLNPVVLIVVTLICFVQVGRAIDNFKIDVTGTLNNAARWSSNAVPGINTNAVWDSRVASIGTNNVGGSMA